jgi:hypothetical protein
VLFLLFYEFQILAVALALHILFRYKAQRRAVYAVPQAAQIGLAVVKDVTEVRVGFASSDFRAFSAVAVIVKLADERTVNGL